MSFTNTSLQNNHSSVNFSDIHYIWGYTTCFEDFRISQWISFLIAGVLLTLASIFGIIGNALSASHLRSLIQREKTPRHLLLLTLSYCDFLVCLYAFVFFGLSVISSHFYALDWYVKWICQWNTYTYPIHVMAFMGSMLSLLAITFERVIVVFKPLQAHSLITFGRTKFLANSIYIFIIAFSIPLLAFYIFADFKTPYDSISNTCEYGFVRKEEDEPISRTSKSKSPLLDSILETYFMILVLLTLWIPLPVITIANLGLLIKIKQNYRAKQSLSVSQIKSLRTTKILMTILLIYSFCGSLQFCMAIAHTLGKTICIELRVIVDFAVVLNCAVNYLIYCTFANGIRDSFRQMLKMVTFNSSSHQQNQNEIRLITINKFKVDL